MAENLDSMLAKARKLSIMGFNISKLKQIFEALEWKVEEKLVEIQPRHVGRDVEEITGGIPTFCFGLGNKSERGYEIRLYVGGNDEKNAHIYETCKKLVGAPKSMKKWTHNFHGITSHRLVIEKDAGYETPKFTFDLDYKLVVPGMEVTSRSGKTFTIHHCGLRDKSINNTELVVWLKEETSFVDEVSKMLGMETPDMAKRKERTRENTGTCGICCKEQKLDRKGNMVHHGYTKPGTGYIHGDCFGVGFKPYELSPISCKNYVDALKEIEENRKSALKLHRAGKIETLQVKGPNYKLIMGHRIYEILTVQKGEPEFVKAQKNVMLKLENEIRQLAGDIEFYTARTNNWKLDTLPWEKLQRK